MDAEGGRETASDDRPLFRPSPYTDADLDGLTGRAWVDALWDRLKARDAFSMLSHPVDPDLIRPILPPPSPVSDGARRFQPHPLGAGFSPPTPPFPPASDAPRVVFFGMASDFGAAHLLALLRAGLPVVAVVTSHRQARHRFPADAFSLVEARTGIPRHAVRRINDAESLDLLRGYRPDLVVIASFDQILKRDLLALPRLGVLNCHPSPLPAYRGPEPLFWQIINAEAEAGATVYRVDEGIDTGPVFGRAVFPVAADQTAGGLARHAAFAGIPILLDAVAALHRGETPPAAPADRPASYYPSVDSRPIDWREPAESIARLVRAGSPDLPPYGVSAGRRLYVARAEARPRAPAGAAPGRVVARHADSVDVATGAGLLRLRALVARLPDYPNEHPPLPLDAADDFDT